jgi:hypothetical protein
VSMHPASSASSRGAISGAYVVRRGFEYGFVLRSKGSTPLHVLRSYCVAHGRTHTYTAGGSCPFILVEIHSEESRQFGIS